MTLVYRSFQIFIGAIATLSFMVSAGANTSLPLNIVTTIRPLQAIIEEIIGNSENIKTRLLLDGHQDAHHASLRPSQLRSIYHADLIVQIGPGLEDFLIAPLEKLSKPDRVLSVIKSDGVNLIQKQQGTVDPHIWLGTANIVAIGEFVGQRLGNIRPGLRLNIEKNTTSYKAQIQLLHADISQLLSGAKSRKYLVIHNGFQYFASEFGLTMHSFELADEHVPPGARQISKFRELVTSGQYDCVVLGFDTPTRAFQSIANDASIATTVIDPLGSDIGKEGDFYSQLFTGIAKKLDSCGR